MEISQSSQLSRECKKRIREGTALAPPHSVIGLKNSHWPINQSDVTRWFKFSRLEGSWMFLI